MDARPIPGSALPLAGEGSTDLRTLLRIVRFPISRAELRSTAIHAGLDHDAIAAIGTLTEESYSGSFGILRELRHHGELRRSA